MLVEPIEEFLSTEVKLALAVSSEDFFTTFSTYILASDRSIRGSSSSIRFEYATKNESLMI